MIELRPFAGLGGADHGWLRARHHFSFANYRDPRRMGWGALRVWNDDEIAPGTGFPPHPHADMEIITYVRDGAITHKDSLGNVGRTGPGDVQVMSAGRGVRHSEFNLESKTTRLFQIWIQTDRPGADPRWDTRPFPRGDRSGRLTVLASGFDEDADALRIGAEARLLGATLRPGERVEYAAAPGRHLYLVSAKGSVQVNGVQLEARDGAAAIDEPTLAFTAQDDAEILLVDAA